MKKVIILVIVSAMSVFTAMAQTSVKYNGEINAGYSIGVGSYPVNRVNLNTIQGIKIGEYFSTGLGLGLEGHGDPGGLAHLDVLAPCEPLELDSVHPVVGVRGVHEFAGEGQGRGFRVNDILCPCG